MNNILIPVPEKQYDMLRIWIPANGDFLPELSVLGKEHFIIRRTMQGNVIIVREAMNEKS